jgi:glycosyltransferase involved in cell wall biosynthesis
MNIINYIIKKFFKTFEKRIKNKIVTSATFHNLVFVTCTLSSLFAKESVKKKGIQKRKKTLIIYSKNSYNYNDGVQTFLEQSGGVRLIKSLIQDVGPEYIRYIGQEEDLSIIKEDEKFEQIIGIVCRNTLLAFKRYKSAHKVYLAVNQAVPKRNVILISLKKKYGVILSPMEMVNPLTEIGIMRRCNTLLVLGNELVGASFESVYGVSGKLINNVRGNYFNAPKKGEERLYDVIYPTSYLCLRKGVMEIMSLALINSEQKAPLKILIIGGQDKLYQDIYSRLNAIPNLTVSQWLSANELRDAYTSSKICLLWSHEEGQVSTVIEAMECGCIPVITTECGLPLDERLLTFDSTSDPEEIYKVIKKTLDSYSQENLNSIREYYDDHFKSSNFEN